MEELKELTFLKMSQQSRNAEEALLVVLNACARVTKKVSEIQWEKRESFGEWLSKLQGQRVDGNNTLVFDCLSYLNLADCILICKDLQGANLQGADLQGANLQGAYLQGAYLQGADLQGAYLQGAYLQGAYLQEAYLQGAYLQEAYLQGANLREADLKWVDTENVDLSEVIWVDDSGNPVNENP